MNIYGFLIPVKMLWTSVSYLEHDNLVLPHVFPLYLYHLSILFQPNELDLNLISFWVFVDFFFPSFIVPVAWNSHCYLFHSKLWHTMSALH